MTPEIIHELRELRETKGLLQRDVADRSELSRDAVHRIESGRTPDPKISSIAAIAEALGVEIELRIKRNEQHAAISN